MKFIGSVRVLSPIYKRLLLKISGEALAGKQKFGIDFEALENLAKVIKKCSDTGTEIAIVVGGGNFWRGRSSGTMNRVKADHMGMLATVINATALSEALSNQGADAKVMTAISFPQIGELYSPKKAINYLKQGKITVFGYGTGNAFFTTDTAASLRASEIEAEAIFKATNVDGIYDCDPLKNPNAKKYSEVSFEEVLSKNLKVMDSTAASMCRDNGIAVHVFNMDDPENIMRELCGEHLGTIAR